MTPDPTSDRDIERLFSQAVSYILRRARSLREMRQYMAKREWPEDAQSAIMERLQESGLVDDLEFGRRWVADRQMLRPRSQRELVGELRLKGLDKSVIEQVLEEMPDDAEVAVLQKLISKKRRTSTIDDARLIAWLMRKGFDRHLIQKVLRENDGQES